MIKKWIAAPSAGALAFASASAMADDKTPPTPVDQAKLKAERDAARAKFAAMSPEEKAATRKSMQAKRVSELTQLELVAQEGDYPMATAGDDAKLKADRAAAKAKWDAMTPEQKAATRKNVQLNELMELDMLEGMSGV